MLIELPIFLAAVAGIGVGASKCLRIRNIGRRFRGDISKCSEGKGSCEIKEKINTHPSEVGVFSTSIFGDMTDPVKKRRYFDPLLKSAAGIKGLIKGWYLRVYIAPIVPRELIDELVKLDVEVYVMARNPIYFEGSMWRFLPAGENIAFVSIDADDDVATTKYGGVYTLPSLIDKWMQTDRPFFQRVLWAINIYVPISAGTWGSKGRAIPDMSDRIEKYCADWFGCDEAFLTKEVWPEFKKRGVYRVGTAMETAFLLAIVLVCFMALNYVIYRFVI